MRRAPEVGNGMGMVHGCVYAVQKNKYMCMAWSKNQRNTRVVRTNVRACACVGLWACDFAVPALLQTK